MGDEEGVLILSLFWARTEPRSPAARRRLRKCMLRAGCEALWAGDCKIGASCRGK